MSSHETIKLIRQIVDQELVLRNAGRQLPFNEVSDFFPLFFCLQFFFVKHIPFTFTKRMCKNFHQYAIFGTRLFRYNLCRSDIRASTSLPDHVLLAGGLWTWTASVVHSFYCKWSQSKRRWRLSLFPCLLRGDFLWAAFPYKLVFTSVVLEQKRSEISLFSRDASSSFRFLVWWFVRLYLKTSPLISSFAHHGIVLGSRLHWSNTSSIRLLQPVELGRPLRRVATHHWPGDDSVHRKASHGQTCL